MTVVRRIGVAGMMIGLRFCGADCGGAVAGYDARNSMGGA
jgi:hypothetical protein